MSKHRIPIVFGAVACWAVLALSPLRTVLEAEMALHMGVQLPLLGAIGAALGIALRPEEPRWLREADWLGLPGISLCIFGAMLWMIPRSLDSALADPSVEAAKFLSMPLLAGLPAAVSWPRLPGIARGFVIANAISMVTATGCLYLMAPVRLCLFYRVDQQATAGTYLIAAGGVTALLCLVSTLIGWNGHADARRLSAGAGP